MPGLSRSDESSGWRGPKATLDPGMEVTGHVRRDLVTGRVPPGLEGDAKFLEPGVAPLGPGYRQDIVPQAVADKPGESRQGLSAGDLRGDFGQDPAGEQAEARHQVRQ